MKMVFLAFLFFNSHHLWAIPIPTGHPNKGSLIAGIDVFNLIKDHPDILKSVSPEEFQFGTNQMAEALLTIGNWGVLFEHQPVWIGDISKKGGGRLAKHLTHQRGVDADIAYLVFKHKLTGHRAQRFHDRFTEQFGMKESLEKNFDLESNYQLLSKIVNELEVTSVYVGCGIYTALEARDKKEKVSTLEHI